MKCPVCGYEAEQDYCEGKEENNFMTMGDENFVKIDCFGKPFETDAEKDDYFERYKKAYLYGCPKCKSVQYDFN